MWMFIFCCLMWNIGSGSCGGELCVGNGGDGKWSCIVGIKVFVVGIGWRLLFVWCCLWCVGDECGNYCFLVLFVIGFV